LNTFPRDLDISKVVQGESDKLGELYISPNPFQTLKTFKMPEYDYEEWELKDDD